MSVEVIASDEFEAWFESLSDAHRVRVAASVDVLEEQGLALGHPRSSAIHGSSIALRELRVQSHGHALRVFYVFDPRRHAVLLVGGDKTGKNNKRFYDAFVALAERIYAQYLAEQAEEEKS